MNELRNLSRAALGIDTSNYTTSVCLYNSEDNALFQYRRLLPVKEGALGLRQSDAVFEHTKQLPELMSELPDGFGKDLCAVGVSDRPSCRENSYMPCFLTGLSAARAISRALGVPLYRFTHQEGHIAAALFSSGRTDLFNKEFLVFHISGGTTDLLKVGRSEDSAFNVELVGRSLDLKMGQAVDRLGNLLGMRFPSGKELDRLAASGENRLAFPTSVNGTDCSISGFENRFIKYLEQGEAPADVARSFFVGLGNTLCKMAAAARESEGITDIVFSGGVASNSIIRSVAAKKMKSVSFADPEFSRDNAAGTALLAYKRSAGEI